MGLGPFHLIALVIIVLVIFGPSRLPGLGKSMGEAIRGFKKGIEGDEIDVTDSQRRENLNAAQVAQEQAAQAATAAAQQNQSNKTRS
jgi:sec-independent protein translocase protein TatA